MLAIHSSQFATATDADEPTVSIHFIQRMTGTQRLKDRALVAYVGALIADHGFPAPLPCPVKGCGATRALRMDSRWRRDAVEAWLDDFLPPELAQRVEDAAAAAAADTMDARAAGLGRPALTVVQ